MISKRECGPAFPRGDYHPNGDGMSLRDWFAGQALAAIITGMMSDNIGNHPIAGGGPAGFAASAYDIADAMLAVRHREAGQ